MRYIGIDPGKSGSVSLIANELVHVCPTPLCEKEYDVAKMYEMLDDIKNDSFCIIERAQAMPGQGTVSMFTFGKGYGLWLMALAACKIPFQVIHSRVWTRKMLDGAPGEGKERAYLVARRLFPNWDPKLKKEHEYADSILLAEYGRRLNIGEDK